MNTTTDTTEQKTHGATWWRKPCHITDDILLSGDLHHNLAAAKRQLDEWHAEGVTHILDCREEWNDEQIVGEHGHGMGYIWHGTHDAGGSQESSWYQQGWEHYLRIFDENHEAKVMVHCHMGINRAPSMAFYLMIREGYEPKEALSLIRTNRPIAACYYAKSAWETFAKETGLSDKELSDGLYEINEFFVENHINLAETIHQIRLVEYK